MRPVKNIFIIDDDEIFVFLATKAIEDTNLVDQIKIFGNGKEAITFLAEIADNTALLPDIILLDLSMPIMDGWGFLEEYMVLKNKIKKKITIYIISSSISPQDIEKAKNISLSSDFVVKPLSKDRFIDILMRYGSAK